MHSIVCPFYSFLKTKKLNPMNHHITNLIAVISNSIVITTTMTNASSSDKCSTAAESTTNTTKTTTTTTDNNNQLTVANSNQLAVPGSPRPRLNTAEIKERLLRFCQRKTVGYQVSPSLSLISTWNPYNLSSPNKSKLLLASIFLLSNIIIDRDDHCTQTQTNTRTHTMM